MDRMTWRCVAVLVLISGCKAPTAPSAMPGAVDGGASAADTAAAPDTSLRGPIDAGAVDATGHPSEAGLAAARAVADAGSSGAASLPARRFERIPGWVGFATASVDEARPGWIPQHPDAEVVAFSEAWEDVEPGAKLFAVTTGGLVELSYVSSGQHRYGCEENTLLMAGFDAKTKVPQGVVWLLPEATRGASTVAIEALPITAGAARRSWKVAGLQFVARRLAERGKGLFELYAKDGSVVDRFAFEKGYMGGAEDGPLDLVNEREIGVPRPIAAFRLSEQGPLVVVLNSHGYEGETFRFVVAPDGGRPEILDDFEGLYFCAF